MEPPLLSALMGRTLFHARLVNIIIHTGAAHCDSLVLSNGALSINGQLARGRACSRAHG